jgi:hypothetical protein
MAAGVKPSFKYVEIARLAEKPVGDKIAIRRSKLGLCMDVRESWMRQLQSSKNEKTPL